MSPEKSVDARSSSSNLATGLQALSSEKEDIGNISILSPHGLGS
jgi:hypothetical protein